MKTIVFDTGPIITFTLNGLLWTLEPLRKKFNGQFIITNDVKRELIIKPLTTKKYKLEALQIMPLLKEGTLKLLDNEEIDRKAAWLQQTSNNIFVSKGNSIHIVEYAEMQALAAAIIMKADAVVIDERTTRLLVEDPKKIAERMKMKLHTGISINEKNLSLIRNEVQGMKVIRSSELAIIAYELGILDKYLQAEEQVGRKNVLEGVLWAVKLQGCSISEEEILQTLKIEGKV
jgi:predicted nucleic acid-binding protein